MKTINARELRNEYARVLKEVQDGESFTITSHGRPVARLAPIPEPSLHGGTAGPREGVPLAEVIGALHFMGPGKAAELRRDIEEHLDTEAVDPFERHDSVQSEQDQTPR